LKAINRGLAAGRISSLVVTVAEEQRGLDEPPTILWAPGSAVLAIGEGDTGEPAVAIWHISPDGGSTGAWVVPCHQAYNDPDVARRLLVSIERRALTAIDPESLDEIVNGLTTAASIDRSPWWTAQRFSPIDAFEELLARRAELEATVASVGQAGRKVAPVTWGRGLDAADRPRTVLHLQQLAGVAEVAGTPVIAEALRLSRLLQWLVGVWTETEQLKGRRDYVRNKHGDPEALPPTWLAAVTTASATRLPL
jgi:hypothetical protein